MISRPMRLPLPSAAVTGSQVLRRDLTPGRYLIEFELFGLPGMANHARHKTHWASRANEARRWKAAVRLAVAASRPMRPVAHARVTCTRLSSVDPDSDGLVSGFKHVLDGLVAAGVLENDRTRNIGMPTFKWERAPPGHGKIRVLVEEVQVGASTALNAAEGSKGIGGKAYR